MGMMRMPGAWGADISVAKLVAKLKFIPAERGQFQGQNISGVGIRGAPLKVIKIVKSCEIDNMRSE